MLNKLEKNKNPGKNFFAHYYNDINRYYYLCKNIRFYKNNTGRKEFED